MDLAEIKQWRAVTQLMYSRRIRFDWLIAEVERLTKTNEIHCRAIEILIGDLRDMFNVPAGQELMPVIEETLSSLTLSRAEGRKEAYEEAAKIADAFVLGEDAEGADYLATDVAAAIREAAQGKNG